MLFANVFTKVSQRLKSKELTRHMRRHTHTQSRARTLSRYRSRISSPQLAHTFFPVDGTDEALDGGEQMDGVDGGLGEERGSSFSILDLWDSPSDCDCQWKLEQCISHSHVNDVYLLDRNILRKIIQPSKTENVKKKIKSACSDLLTLFEHFQFKCEGNRNVSNSLSLKSSCKHKMIDIKTMALSKREVIDV